MIRVQTKDIPIKAVGQANAAQPKCNALCKARKCALASRVTLVRTNIFGGSSTKPYVTSVRDKKAARDHHCERSEAIQEPHEESKVSSQGLLAVIKPVPFAPGLPRTQPLRAFGCSQ
jgi:hypothetical protein